MLILVATPIGNLGDFSQRAIEALKGADLILCEDTRHSKKLLDHFEIQTPLKSYHKFSEAKQEEGIIRDLKAGKEIALISDAGSPAISDPGERLVRRCRDEGLEVTAVPGPCALITALQLSGMESSKFQFIGFLPRKEGELRRALAEAEHFDGTTIAYEAPGRVQKTLRLIRPETEVCVARELTKKFEEVRRGTAQDLREMEIRGECVLLIKGDPRLKDLGAKEHVQLLIDEFGLPKNEAIKLAAKLRGVGKSEVYDAMHIREAGQTLSLQVAMDALVTLQPGMAAVTNALMRVAKADDPAAEAGRIKEESEQAVEAIAQKAAALGYTKIATISSSGTVNAALEASGAEVVELEDAEAVWVGADAITDAEFANARGTSALINEAISMKIPVYVLAEPLKYCSRMPIISDLFEIIPLRPAVSILS